MNRDPLGEKGFTRSVSIAGEYLQNEDAYSFYFEVNVSDEFGFNKYVYIDNTSVNHFDYLGLRKGGKQNISVNHNGQQYNRHSNQNDVRDAMNDAKKNKQSNAFKALRGLLKVIKRGGRVIPIMIPPGLFDDPYPAPKPDVSPTCSETSPCNWECTCPSGYTPFGQTNYKQKNHPKPQWDCKDSNSIT